MKKYSIYFVLSLFVLTTFGVTEIYAQKSRRKSAPRRTSSVVPRAPINPAAQVRTLEPEVISRADDIVQQENNSVGEAQTVIDPATGRSQRRNRRGSGNGSTQNADAAELARQVNALTNKIKSLEEQQRTVIDLERLTRAEERAENLRKQLADVIEREAAINSKLEQLDYQTRPENIQSETAVIGSLRPEDVRESRRKMLESEKTRIREQLTLLQTNRAKLETAVANADSLVERLRSRVQTQLDKETESGVTVTSRDSNTTKQTDVSDEETGEPPL